MGSLETSPWTEPGTYDIREQHQEQAETPPQPEAVAGWDAWANQAMRPEEGKDGASRAPARLSCF